MPAVKKPRPPSPPPVVSSSAPGLHLSGPSLRLRAAQKAHDQLMAQVARRRGEIDRLEARIRSAVTSMAARMVPIAEEGRRLDREIHGMFEALLQAKRSQRAHKQIRQVYLGLQESETLSPRGDGHAADGGDPFAEPPFDFGGGRPRFTPAHTAPRQEDRGALRELYRRLVEALHPDQVQDEAAKAHRTEVMKDVNVAFRDSDFARLVEIERAWAADPVAPAGGDDLERRQRALGEANVELRKQLRALDRQLRRLRQSPEAQLAREAKAPGKAGSEGGIAPLVDEAERALQGLRELHAFVAAFRDGQISLKDFLDGPLLTDPAELEVEEALLAFMRFAEELAPPRPKRGGGGPRRGRS